MQQADVNPLDLFYADREQASAAQDPMAPLCTVANIDQHGRAQIRTLVLRDVDGQLAIFVNGTSPKWPHLQNGFVLHTFWPSMQIQYRMQVTATPLAAEIVHDSWHLRPEPPKRMDWFYEQHAAQSSPIDSRHKLLEKVGGLKLPEPPHAPDNARGLLMTPTEIERLDLTQPEGIHDRQLFTRHNGAWRRDILVP